MSLSQLVLDTIDRLKQYNLGIYNAVSNKFGLSGVGGMAANWSRHSKDIATACETVGTLTEAAAGSENNAAASAEAAAGSAQSAEEDAQATAADRVATGQDRQATAADRQVVAQDRDAVHADRLAADADAAATSADRQAVATDKAAVRSDRLAADADAAATAADRQAVFTDAQATHQDRLAADAAKEAAQAAALSAAGIIQHVQPGEIAGIDPIIDFPFRAATAIPSGVIQGTSGKWVTGPNGLLTLAPAGTAPINFAPATGALRGLLAEEARPNLLLQSRNFASTTAWGPLTGVSATQNATGPDGAANTAWTIADTSASGFGERYQDVTVANDTATRVFWAIIKAGTSTRVSIRIEYIGGTGVSGSIDVNPVAGTIVGQVGTIYDFKPLYGGYYLAYIALANNGTGNTVCRGHIIPSPVSASDQTSVVVYHAQIEPGIFPTSMVPTTSSTVTRAGDLNSLLLSGVPGWNAAEGTLYLECDTITTASSATEQYFLQLDDGTQNNRITVTRTNGGARAYGVVSGSTVFDFNLGAWTSTNTQKIAVGFANNSFIANLNGAAVQTDLSGAVPPLTTLRLGSAATGTNQANGHIRRAVAWGRQLASPIYPLLTA